MNGIFGVLGFLSGLGALGGIGTFIFTIGPSYDPNGWIRTMAQGNEQAGRYFILFLGLICLVVFILITVFTNGLPSIRNLL